MIDDLGRIRSCPSLFSFACVDRICTQIRGFEECVLALKTACFTSAGVLCLLHRGVAIEKWVDLQVDLVVLLP